MEELKNALTELYVKHENHEIIVDLSQILDRYIEEEQRRRLECLNKQ